MDIGEAGWGSDDCNMQTEEMEIDMVVSAWTKCHRCEGYRHMSRYCATPTKGKGKDGKGGQTSNGKGGHQYHRDVRLHRFLVQNSTDMQKKNHDKYNSVEQTTTHYLRVQMLAELSLGIL